MMRSLYSGVSGLRVHQTKMDVIGNNISNVNTIGFKSSRVTFSDIFSQKLSGASSPNAESGRAGTNPQQIGLGVSVASIDNIMTGGAPQVTNNANDVSIEGEGFFIVGDGSGQYFTRAGAFSVDKEGNLGTPMGMKVYGWSIDEKGEIQKGKVTPLAIKTPQNMYIEPQITTAVGFEGNLYTGDADDAGQSIRQTIAFYDSLGNRYTTDLVFKYKGGIDSATGTANAAGRNKWDISFPKNSAGSTVMYMNGDIKKPIEFTVGNTNIELAFNQAGKVDIAASTGLNNGIMALSIAGQGLPVDSKFSDPINIDFTQLTQFNEKTTAQAQEKDGLPPGTLENYSIGTDGVIVGKYSNGLEKKLGQLAVAKFKNPAGLEKVGNNLFTTTPNSGSFDGIGQDPTTGGGSLKGGTLEMSNVDLASEFTEMITTQRGFQANSKIITTSDDMLQELVNLKR